MHATNRGLTWGMILRAIQAADSNRVGKKRCWLPPIRPHDIACNALPCGFAPLGLPPQIARTPHAPIASEALATVGFPPFGSSKKPGLTRFGGVGRNPRTKAAYSEIQPPSKTCNQLFAYVIRFRGNIHVTDASGETRTAANWAELAQGSAGAAGGMPAEGGRSGRARKLRGARVTASHAYQVGAVVCVHARDMKEPWCLAASDAEAPAGTLIKQYARRWTIEPSFRDTKDLRFGMGMAEIRIAEPERRDRLLLISAFAIALLTMLGTAGESLGMDRLLKSNTSKTRTHSLFRQGCMLYELIPNMPEHRLLPLMQRFAEMLVSCGLFDGFLSGTKMRGWVRYVPRWSGRLDQNANYLRQRRGYIVAGPTY